MAWCTAWLWRHAWKVVNSSSPNTVPSHVFAALGRQNEPCVQSWKTMYVRTRKPAAGIASASVSR